MERSFFYHFPTVSPTDMIDSTPICPILETKLMNTNETSFRQQCHDLNVTRPDLMCPDLMCMDLSGLDVSGPVNNIAVQSLSHFNSSNLPSK